MKKINMFILVVIWYVLFLTSDNIYKYISNMGNNLTPYSVATGGEN